MADMNALAARIAVAGLLPLALEVWAPAHDRVSNGRQDKQPVGISTTDARALLAKVVEGLGGETAVRSVRSTRTKSHLVTRTFMGDVPRDIEKVAVFPDQLWEHVVMPGSEMSIAISPQGAFIHLPNAENLVNLPKGPVDLPAAMKAETLRELRSDPLYVAQQADDPRFTFSAGGSQKVGEVQSGVLDVNADGVEVRWCVDPQTGRILRMSGHLLWMGGPGEQVIDLADWRSVQGVTVPFRATITLGGQGSGWLEIKEFEVNPRVDPKLFDKT
jgi:hypothetical protein